MEAAMRTGVLILASRWQLAVHTENPLEMAFNKQKFFPRGLVSLISIKLLQF
jgi:hypothetical protein